jgi:hypothetical protein
MGLGNIFGCDGHEGVFNEDKKCQKMKNLWKFIFELWISKILCFLIKFDF